MQFSIQSIVKEVCVSKTKERPIYMVDNSIILKDIEF